MKRNLSLVLDDFATTLLPKAREQLRAPLTGVRVCLKEAGIGNRQLETLYGWHDGAEPTKGRRDFPNFLGWPWRMLSLEEALKRRTNWLKNKNWQSGWIPVFVDWFNPRSYIAFDSQAKARQPAVLQLTGATIKSHLADDLYGLFAPFVEVHAKGWLTKEHFIHSRRTKDFEQVSATLNPLAAQAERETKAGSIDQMVNGLLRCRTPSTGMAVEDIVWRAEQVAKSDHPQASLALLQAYKAFMDFGAAESIIDALRIRPKKEVSAAIVDRTLSNKGFEEAGLELFGLHTASKLMFAEPSVIEQLLAATKSRTPRQRKVAREMLRIFEDHPFVKAFFEEQSTEDGKKKSKKKAVSPRKSRKPSKSSKKKATKKRQKK